jgi:hypothetical protein
MDAIDQLVSSLDCDLMARQPTVEANYSLKNFHYHNFGNFDGTGDHISIENWLNDIQELLSTTRCIEEQKLAYTAFLSF